jgi:hypothetical protein
LAFHPYPQLIQAVFNRHWFGPPARVTGPSPWPRVDHSASRLLPATSTPYSDSLSLRLAYHLTSLQRVTSRLIMQKARGHPPKGGLPPHVGTRFQVLFHCPKRGTFHLSLTVLVHYRSPARIQPWVMVHPNSRRIPRVPRYLGVWPGVGSSFAYRAFTFSGRRFHGVQLEARFVTPWAFRSSPRPLPRPRHCSACGLLTQRRFGLFPVRSPLLRESLLLSFPGGTEMVHFPPFASARLCVQRGMAGHYPGRVSPFGHPRIKTRLRLPGAYRSSLRPSSPSGTKASIARP